MSNNYFISPIGFSDSIFLTYQGNQPFASFGRKTPLPGVTSLCLPSAPPEDKQPRGLVSEFLLIHRDGCIGKKRKWKRIEAGPTGKRPNLYRMDLRSQYAEPWLDASWLRWNTATVSFGGKPVRMLWHDCWDDGWDDCKYGGNPLATSLAQQEHAVLPSYLAGRSITVRSTAYLVLGQMWKPVVDIRTTKYPLASDFEREVRRLIKGWWHAIEINGGWRLYADDINELFMAKMAIST